MEFIKYSFNTSSEGYMNIRSVVILLAAVVWLGCSDSNGTNDGSGGNSSLTGDLTGTINLIDFRGYSKLNKSGVLVQLDGTPYSAITDSLGVWTIHNLPTRTYSITFSKEGCCTWKDKSFSFTGGGIVRYKYTYKYDNALYSSFNPTIRELPLYTITLDLILPYYVYSDSAKGYIYVNGGIFGHTSSDAPPVSLSAYCISSNKPTLSLEDRSSYQNFFWYNSDVYDFNFYNSSNKDTTTNLLIKNFPALLQGFSKGDIVYFKVYPGIGRDFYYDAIEDKTIPIGFSNNGSNVLSLVVP
jgi:hypothetical protein